ncbi:MAG: hypothetical protein HY901_01170 [Deltaproteobacteria bacterium]|nr:hypothetical protein [Deltaproteobacteria bacterium]
MAQRKKHRSLKRGTRPVEDAVRRHVVEDDDGSELLPQWDTAAEEPYFVRAGDGVRLSEEEAGAILCAREAKGRTGLLG